MTWIKTRGGARAYPDVEYREWISGNDECAMVTLVTEEASAAAAAEETLTGNCFVAAYPPFSAWNADEVPMLESALRHSPPAKSPLGLYLHLPFCRKKCDYCYYLSYVDQKPEVVDRYLQTLMREFDLYSRQPAVTGRKVSFVYFGGGTPSTLTPAQVTRLGAALRGALQWDDVKEITFECAPRSVTAKLLKALRDIGINRLSMGVQSFDDDLLRLNGRVHLADDVTRAFDMIRDAGFECVNLDLMVGLIGETEEKWRETVARVIQLSPESITIYQTEIPFNTKLCRDLESGSLPVAPVAWDVKRARLDEAFLRLEEAGYSVVTAYAVVKDPEKHRFHYQDELWRGGDMLGLGVASFGYFSGVHYQNEVTLQEYEAAVDRGSLPVKRARALSADDQLVREFILQLKLGRVDAASFRDKFGIEISEAFASPLGKMQRSGLLNIDGAGVTLTRPGLLRVDRLLPEFYDSRYVDLRYT